MKRSIRGVLEESCSIRGVFESKKCPIEIGWKLGLRVEFWLNEIAQCFNTENGLPAGNARADSLSFNTDRTLVPSGGSH